MSQITTHILDTASGRPASGVQITLFRQLEGEWATVAGGKTDADGRIGNLCQAERPLDAGTYRLHFDIGKYFDGIGSPVFYPYAEVVFNIEGNGQHYHIPLLLSPYGYSTYRGS